MYLEGKRHPEVEILDELLFALDENGQLLDFISSQEFEGDLCGKYPSFAAVADFDAYVKELAEEYIEDLYGSFYFKSEAEYYEKLDEIISEMKDLYSLSEFEVDGKNIIFRN